MTFATARRKIFGMAATNDAPWFHEGLRFHCTQCGDCCTGAPGFVWITDDELQAIADFLEEPIEQVRALHTYMASRGRTLREKTNGDCVFFERTAGCTIYSVRPTQCRTWPFWETNVSTPKRWEKTCEICPGSGKGELISAEEIMSRLNAIRL